MCCYLNGSGGEHVPRLLPYEIDVHERNEKSNMGLVKQVVQPFENMQTCLTTKANNIKAVVPLLAAAGR